MKATKAKLVPIADLTGNPENPREITPERLEELKASIQEDPEFLWARPLVATSSGLVYAGNQRLRAATELGMTRVPVVTLDGTPDEIQLRTLRDNQEYGEWETAAVGKMLAGLKERGVDAGLSGFEKGEIEAAVAAWRRQERGDPEQVPDITGDAASKPGEVYELGEHRLMCGDATSPRDVAKLLDGQKPNLMVTDPPYGVDYDGGAPSAVRKRDKLEGDGRDAAWEVAFKNAPGSVAYVWHAGIRAGETYAALESCGFKVRAQIVWVKTSLKFGAITAHYKPAHEPMLYAVKGSASWWCGPKNEKTIWEIAQPARNELHPTQKPTECMMRPIQNHEGDVYDPFLGSGTTLIAAEQLGRICYGMEISPAYCDVIRQRYADFVGDQRWAP